ncbi:MAG: LapA family protein [Azoarcus sp.]|nr:LapA family protein [Azoarcus sp.]
MRALIWFIRFILFVLLFGFAVKNDHVADLYFFFGKQWHLPLVFIILIAFAVGALLGVTATITSLLRQRREISRLGKQLARAELAAEQASDDAMRVSEPY